LKTPLIAATFTAAPAKHPKTQHRNRTMLDTKKQTESTIQNENCADSTANKMISSEYQSLKSADTNVLRSDI